MISKALVPRSLGVLPSADRQASLQSQAAKLLKRFWDFLGFSFRTTPRLFETCKTLRLSAFTFQNFFSGSKKLKVMKERTTERRKVSTVQRFFSELFLGHADFFVHI